MTETRQAAGPAGRASAERLLPATALVVLTLFCLRDVSAEVANDNGFS